MSPMTDTERQEIAWRSVERFRRMIPRLESFLYAATGKRIQVVMRANEGSSTDGKKVYLCPPFELGYELPHDGSKCDRVDSLGYQLCAACAVREEITVNIHHEASHIAFGTFDGDVSEVNWSLVSRYGFKKPRYFASVDLYNFSKKVDKYIPYLMNAIEDIRVDREMYKARPGLERMGLMSDRAIAEGKHIKDNGEPLLWKETALDAQIVGACYFRGKYGNVPSQVFAPEIHEMLEDPKLAKLLDKTISITSVIQSFELSCKVLSRLRELGFMHIEKTWTPPPPPEPEPEEQEQNDDQEGSDAGESESEGESESSNPDGNEGSRDNQQDEGTGDEPGESDDTGEQNESEQGEPEQGAPGGADADGDSDDSDSDEREMSGDPAGAGSEEHDDASSGDDGAPAGSEAGSESDECEGAPAEGDGGDLSDDSSDQESGDEGDPDSPDESGDGVGGDDAADPTAGGEAGGQDHDDLDGPDESDGGDPHESESESGSESDLSDDSNGDLDGPATDGATPDGAGDGDRATDAPAANVEPPTGTLDTPPPPATWEEYVERHGVEEALKEALEMILGHETEINLEGEPVMRDELQVAIQQSDNFEEPSSYVKGVIEQRPNRSGVWGDLEREGSSDMWQAEMLKNSEGIEIPAGLMNQALMKLRHAFEENRRAKFERNLNRGRVNKRALGRKAWSGDDRVLQKKEIPAKKDYAVIIGMDVSGSTYGGTRLRNEKMAVMGQANLLDRVGVTFSIVAHTGASHRATEETVAGSYLGTFVIKDFDEPWGNTQKQALLRIWPQSANLDGHALEHLRRKVEARRETNKLIMYYSDGAMPAENFHEELRILQREMKYIKQRGIGLAAVGIENDEPRSKYGIPMVLFESESDILPVIDHVAAALGIR